MLKFIKKLKEKFIKEEAEPQKTPQEEVKESAEKTPPQETSEKIFEKPPSEIAFPEEILTKKESSEETIQGFSEEEKSSFFQKIKIGLSKTKEKFSSALSEIFEIDKTVDLETLEEIEEKLITADIGVDTVLELLEPFREKLLRGESFTTREFKNYLRERLLEFIKEYDRPFPPSGNPAVLFFIGVNGVGKTTTVAKIGKRLKDAGYSVVLVAADTFRAAAIDQLKKWGERIGAPVISLQEGSDPGAVIYQGITFAQKKGIDIVLIDTAGRLHTKYNLIEELKKMNRVILKLVPKEAKENILVLDATTGQNAINQAKHFSEAIGIDHLIITKLDGTTKGGVAITVSHRFNLPISFIGLGEKADDLVPFDKEAFVKAILP